MGSKSSRTKGGVRSTSVKRATSRHGTGAGPQTRAVAGAFGKEGLDRDSGGKLRKPSPATSGRRRNRGRAA